MLKVIRPSGGACGKVALGCSCNWLCTPVNNVLAGPQQAAISGNPTFFTTLVATKDISNRFVGTDVEQMEEIRGKIIYYACGSSLRMDTEAAGAAYMEAQKQAKRHCPHIICRANGRFIDSSGVVSDDSNYNAPKTLAALGGYFGSMLKPQRPEYRRLHAAIQGLMSVVALQRSVQEAQVSSKHDILSC